MLIDVALSPSDIARLPGRDLSGTTCVVFDVLRATSSMVTGLAHGIREIHPVRTIEEALTLKGLMPEAVLGGERNGDPVPGFDIGNAPHEYVGLGGKRVVTTTTNGTVALRACETAQRTLVGALLNLDAVARDLMNRSPRAVLLVCAGTFDDFALEDAYAAGLLINALGEADLTDSARAAQAVARSGDGALATLQASRNGQVLAANGRGAEVEWCARQSVFTVVGEMQRAVIRPLQC